MKIVHTFLPLNEPVISKNNLLLMTLSMLLAKKNYDKVVLYTNVETANFVRKIGLPYDEINDQLLEGKYFGTFSIPKMLVYSVQTEPYIHIDIDSFLFYKLTVSGQIRSAYNEGAKCMVSFDDYGMGFLNTYFLNTFKIKDLLPPDFVSQISFRDIPNMCIFGGENYELISEATLYCLKLYEENKNFFDSYYYNACIIEQLFIPSAIKLLIKDNKKYENVKIEYMFGENPTLFNFLGKETMEYPIEINSNGDKTIIENDLDLYEKNLYNFNGFLHLSGYKSYNKLLYIIRSKVIYDFGGIGYINKINEIYPEVLDYEKDFNHYQEMKKKSNKKKSLI